MTKQQKKNIEAFLNERQDIYDNLGQREADHIYIRGAITALEIAGFTVEWSDDKESYIVY